MITLNITADCGCKLVQTMMVRNMKYPAEPETYSIIGHFAGDIIPCCDHKKQLYPKSDGR